MMEFKAAVTSLFFLNAACRINKQFGDHLLKRSLGVELYFTWLSNVYE